MNKTLNALLTKLTWQRDELIMHLKVCEQKMLELSHDLNQLKKQFQQANVTSLDINPELEINRLNFITQIQTKKDVLVLVVKEQQQLEVTLKEKLLRVKTELTMLERYLQKQSAAQKKQLQQKQQNNADEWILQHRD